MLISIRLGAFFVWVLATVWVVVDKPFVLNALAINTQWGPGINQDALLNITTLTSEIAKSTRSCTNLREELGSDIVQVYGEEEYVEAMRNPASFFNSIQRPACVVVPRVDVHVQRAMATIYRDRVRYAVMSGGHTGMTGWNSFVFNYFL